MTERWYCFVAASIDEPLRLRLDAARTPWLRRPDLAGLRWTDPDRWHLTLAFLGEVEPATVPDIVQSVSSVARRHAPLRVPVGGLGAFGSPAAARVAWYGVRDPDGHLANLAGDLARSLGLSTEDPYRPHVTLARARGEPVDLRRWVGEAGATAPSATLEIDRLEVMRSHRGPVSPTYETLAALPLEGFST